MMYFNIHTAAHKPGEIRGQTDEGHVTDGAVGSPPGRRCLMGGG